MSTQKTLQVNNLHVYYGKIQALKGVSLHVNEGEIVALLGANGGGKTTLLKAITGLVDIQEGTIYYQGNRIDGMETEKIVSRHIAHVPEHRQIFRTLTVYDNLLLGAYHRYKKLSKAEKEKDLDLIFEFFPILKEREDQLAGTLSGGQQQMLAIARAMMSKPDLLLLDEPTLGLAPIVVREVLDLILKLNETLGMSILLIEQNVVASLKITNRAYVISNGEIVKEGPSKDLLHDKEIKEAYLGHSVVS